ncbi:MAG: hypothetical protein CSA07_01395 [Bacteroidia bacterium]|nr:MAG: hypothetical protein CSA07_01395 [Bacteroidia bacterium]
MDLSFIASLLANNARLILPGIGAFLVKENNGSFQVDNVVFSPFLKYDDKVLQNAIAQKQALGPEQAKEKVKALVAYVQNELKTRGQCPIPKLGLLKIDSAGAILFHPDASVSATTPAPQPAPATPPVTKTEAPAPSPAPAATPPATKPEAPAPKPTPAAAPPAPPVTKAPTPGQTATPPPATPSTPTPATKPGQTPEAATPQKPAPQPPKGKGKPAPQRHKPQKKAAAQGEKTSSGGGGRAVLVVILVLLLLGAGYGIADYFYFHKIFSQDGLLALTLGQKEVVSTGNGQPDAQQATGQAQTQAEPAEVSEMEQEYNRQANQLDPGSEPQLQPTPPSQPEPAPRPQPQTAQEDYAQTEEYGQEGQGADEQYGQVEKYPSPSSTNIYHIIFGSFQNVEYAEKHMENLVSEGFNAQQLIRPDGMHAVVVGSFPSRGEAVRALSRVRTKYPNAWILQQ